jgi:pimeloyl-ACP methyl ester carboxylesterase
MRYLDVGPSDGPGVFLLHGYTDTSRSMAPVMDALHRLLPGLDLIDLDLRGHGASSLPAGAGCPAAPDTCFQRIDFARDIVAFTDARHIARATMVGHSMGTLVAQELGLSFPQRVDRLVLISTATDGQSEPAVGDLLGLVDGVWEPAFEAAGYSWPAGVYGVPRASPPPTSRTSSSTGMPTRSPTRRSSRRSSLRQPRSRSARGSARLEAITETDNTQRLERLTRPTLVLWAVQDAIFSPDTQQKLIGALDVAAAHGGSFWWKQYGVLPPPASGEQTDFGHNLVWEAPGAVALDIASFLVAGRPTDVLFHSGYPEDIRRVVAEPGHAILVHAP